jgi:hypothetical protein
MESLTPAHIKFLISTKKRRKYYLLGKKVFVGTVTFDYKEDPFITEEWRFYGDTKQECLENGHVMMERICKSLGLNWKFDIVDFNYGKFIEESRIMQVIRLYKNDINAPIWFKERSGQMVVRGTTGSIIECPSHLYVISEPKSESNTDGSTIQDGDWFYDSSDNSVKQWKGNLHSNRLTSKKIEATTDKSLILTKSNTKCIADQITGNEVCLPKLSPVFIEAYVKAQGKISEVNVMIEQYQIDDALPSSGAYRIKIRPDNTIIINRFTTQ